MVFLYKENRPSKSISLHWPTSAHHRGDESAGAPRVPLTGITGGALNAY